MSKIYKIDVYRKSKVETKEYNQKQEENEEIVIEDDGTGMNDEEFRNRWMTLNYDRQKRQGKEVQFSPDVKSSKRIPYGRNGMHMW